MEQWLILLKYVSTIIVGGFVGLKGFQELMAYFVKRDQEKSVGKAALEAQDKKIKGLQDELEATRKDLQGQIESNRKLIQTIEDQYRDMVREALGILKNH